MTDAETLRCQFGCATAELAGPAAFIEFKTAQPKNSFRAQDLKDVDEAIDFITGSGARALLLHGGGGIFCAGWDVDSIDPKADDPTHFIKDLVGPFTKKLRELPFPTVTAVEGAALAFGFGFALCSDICVAAEDAKFGSPFGNIGMVPDTGTHAFMLQRLGFPIASELIYTSRLLTGTEAAARGLINRATPKGEAVAVAREMVVKMANGPTQAFRLSKEILLKGGDVDSIIAYESDQLAKVFKTEDLHEGILAFKQRRKPDFKGR